MQSFSKHRVITFNLSRFVHVAHVITCIIKRAIIVIILQTSIAEAKHRIIMASLYLGSGALEQEIVRIMIMYNCISNTGFCR